MAAILGTTAYMLPTAVRRTHRADMPSAVGGVGGVEADVTVELSPLGSEVQIHATEGFILLPKPWPPGVLQTRLALPFDLCILSKSAAMWSGTSQSKYGVLGTP